MRARFALVLTGCLLLAGCPGDEKTPPPPPVNGAPIWATQAEVVVKKLEELVASVTSGDKEGALKAHESAYFECYENTEHNLEVASQRFLPQEKLDENSTKLYNVAVCREEKFAEIKTAVKIGAPIEKVRGLVDELETKIRADAKKLDEMKVTAELKIEPAVEKKPN